jgi:cobalamin biosynthesis protein CbiD
MDVARAAGFDKVVLSTGRTSERAHLAMFGLPNESYIMMSDQVVFPSGRLHRVGSRAQK